MQGILARPTSPICISNAPDTSALSSNDRLRCSSAPPPRDIPREPGDYGVSGSSDPIKPTLAHRALNQFDPSIIKESKFFYDSRTGDYCAADGKRQPYLVKNRLLLQLIDNSDDIVDKLGEGEIPVLLHCAMSMDKFVMPVIAHSSGQTYDHSYLAKWYNSKRGNKDPLTRNELDKIVSYNKPAHAILLTFYAYDEARLTQSVYA